MNKGQSLMSLIYIKRGVCAKKNDKLLYIIYIKSSAVAFDFAPLNWTMGD